MILDEDVLDRLRERYPRYHETAYVFILSALHFVLERLEEPRHISGRELVAGVRDLAIQRFGPMARTVLEHWGIRATADVGELVFALVDAGIQDILIVTGGNSGIGLATAKKFAAQGAKVAVSGRDRKTLDQAAREIGPGTLAVQADVTDLRSLDALFSRVKDMFGSIDVLFVNAGVARFAPVAEVTVEQYDELLDTNLKGSYFTVQKALRLLNPGAAVILTTTAADTLGLPGSSVYAASKAAVRSLARTLSAELIERKVRVNAIAPGPIETPIFGRLGLAPQAIDELAKVILGRVPAKRLGQTDEIADAVLFLASPGASYIIGVELNVDGGMSQL